MTSLPSLEQSQIIIPKLHLPETAEPLRFDIRERSEFGVLWDGYPKRRKLSPSENDTPAIVGSNGGAHMHLVNEHSTSEDNLTLSVSPNRAEKGPASRSRKAKARVPSSVARNN